MSGASLPVLPLIIRLEGFLKLEMAQANSLREFAEDAIPQVNQFWASA